MGLFLLERVSIIQYSYGFEIVISWHKWGNCHGQGEGSALDHQAQERSERSLLFHAEEQEQQQGTPATPEIRPDRPEACHVQGSQQGLTTEFVRYHLRGAVAPCFFFVHSVNLIG